MEINREIKNITSAFVLEDNLTECVPYGSGHINDTYRLTSVQANIIFFRK